MLKLVIVVGAATLVTPALAEEYWVRYDYSTHECSVVQSDTHQTETRFPWSAPNDGSKPTEPLSGEAHDTTGAPARNETGNPNGSTSASESANGSDKRKDSTIRSGIPNENGASSPPNSTSGAPAAGNPNNEESESPVVAAWKRKAELAEKEKIDVSKALVGSAMQTREEAEDEMKIMRICGLKN